MLSTSPRTWPRAADDSVRIRSPAREERIRHECMFRIKVRQSNVTDVSSPLPAIFRKSSNRTRLPAGDGMRECRNDPMGDAATPDYCMSKVPALEEALSENRGRKTGGLPRLGLLGQADPEP